MYISNVRIRNYKNFYKENIPFQKTITTVIGENGTGKTNLFNAIRLLIDKDYKHFFHEDEFSYELKTIKGQWIIISIELSEVPSPLEEPQAAEFNPKDGKSLYTLIFRPKKTIRNELFNIYEKLKIEKDEAEKVKIKMELETYISNISIISDYEIIRTVGGNFDFLNDDIYKQMVGDFEKLKFPNPDDIQEDKSIIGDLQNSNISDYLNQN